MDKKDLEKLQLGKAAIGDFLEQFPKDDSTNIVLEELFKVLLNVKDISVYGEQEQIRREDTQCLPKQNDFVSDESER